MKRFLLVYRRLLIQIGFFFAQNPFIGNFFRGRLYGGKAKQFCTPGFNCYSCPAAVTSCPVGALQLFFAGVKFSMTLFVTGFLVTIGTVFGRLICGYVCPFGLFQDLAYKIKTRKFKPRLRYARYLKYVILLVFVIILPCVVRDELSGLGSPWFCKYICPNGTIFGAFPLVAVNDYLRESGMLGGLFALKVSLAVSVTVASVFISRIFCRVLCPLGAVYSLFNRFAVFRMSCDRESCVSCGKCEEVCPVSVNPSQTPNSPECIRCGSCKRSCGVKALK
ncbi:MAG: 4Fe-4S binding protein [Oscillospiraceae bacterium]|nr:4Fe-4S binding protein [Oscillospiraceae bacterium]